MTPDIKIRDYYLQFIHNAKDDVRKYKQILEDITKLKEITYNYIDENKVIVYEKFNINLDDIEIEWINKTYNPKEYLYSICIKLIKTINEDNNRILLLQLIKYCNLLRKEYNNNKLIELANARNNLKYSVYRKYIYNYYTQVHKCVLQGMGYKFGYGIGTYVINRWVFDETLSKKKKYIDFKATYLKKKELLEKGIKLYDDKEAAWYVARNIPYNAVDYRVYKEANDWYEFTFLHSDIVRKSALEYKRTEYIALKHRGLSYKDMADTLCKTEEDIYNLQVDVKYKLNILLYKYPTKYLNFIRNAEQCKFKRGAHNS